MQRRYYLKVHLVTEIVNRSLSSEEVGWGCGRGRGLRVKESTRSKNAVIRPFLKKKDTFLTFNTINLAPAPYIYICNCYLNVANPRDKMTSHLLLRQANIDRKYPEVSISFLAKIVITCVTSSSTFIKLFFREKRSIELWKNNYYRLVDLIWCIFIVVYYFICFTMFDYDNVGLNSNIT